MMIYNNNNKKKEENQLYEGVRRKNIFTQVVCIQLKLPLAHYQSIFIYSILIIIMMQDMVVDIII